MTPRRRLALLLTVVSIAACTAPSSREVDTIGPAPRLELENGSFTFDHDGHRIHYEVHGEGPILMTVPNSWGLSLEGLRGLYAPLEEHVTMVYFDPRGMGGSSPVREESDRGPAAVREDFESLRNHLGLARVNVIGWSNGATNLILLASEHPDVFSKAIFLHGDASFLPDDAKAMGEGYPELFEAFDAFAKEMKVPELTEGQRDARVKAFNLGVWFPVMFADRESAVAKLQETFGDATFSWAHSTYTQTEWPKIDFRGELSKIRAKSLVITGAHDMLPIGKGEEIADGIPDATFVLFEDSGHFAPLEEPAKFQSMVLEFLEDDVGSASHGG
jgi:proline iminopeptidase